MNSIIRDIATLAKYTLLAQIITLLSIPILTRLFDPSAISVLGIFTAIAVAVSPLITGRYELAIVTCASKVDSIRLLGISILYCILFFLLSLSLAEPVAKYFSLEVGLTSKGLLILPFFILFQGVFNSLRYYLNSKEEYRSMGRGLLIQSVSVALISIVPILLLDIESTDKSIFLLFGMFFGVIFSSVYYISKLNIRNEYKVIFNLIENYKLAVRYKNFPLYNSTSGFINALSMSLPVILLAKEFSLEVVGYYVLLVKVASSPLSFISRSVSQVHLKKVSGLVQSNNSPVKYLRSIVFFLFLIIFPPCIISYFVSEGVFTMVFGAEWAEAGKLFKYIFPIIAFKFVVSSVSSTISATGNLFLYFCWSLFDLAQLVIIFNIFSPILTGFEYIIVMSVCSGVSYLFYLLIIFYAAKKPKKI